MNIIFNAVYQPYTLLCTDKLAKYYKAQNVFIVFANEELRKAFSSHTREQYLHDECLKAKYSKKLYSDKLIPLDKPLVEAFSPYMLMALKMCERINDEDLSFEGRFDLVCKSLEYWNTVIESENIELYVSYDIPHEIYDYIIYGLCKIKNIRCAFLKSTPIMGHSTIVNDIENFCPDIEIVYKKLYDEYRNTETDDIPLKDEFLKHYNAQSKHTKDILPFYMQGTVEAPRLKGFARTKNIVRLITKEGFKPIREWVYLKKRKLIYKNSSSGKYHKKWNSCCEIIDLNKKFIYFPLHLQPECTTSPQGDCFTWQMLAIKMISFALPEDVFIYVKENPKQTQKGRTENYINLIKEIPRVKLVPKDFNTYSLIENCVAVASITGTAVWEGLFKNKPGLIFGNTICKYAPGVFKIATNDECKNAIEKILATGSEHSLKELKLFVKAISELSALGFSWCPPYENTLTNEEISQSLFNLFTKNINTIFKEC